MYGVLSKEEVVTALYLFHGDVPFNDPVACKKNIHIMKFDGLVQDIIKICDKVGGAE